MVFLAFRRFRRHCPLPLGAPAPPSLPQVLYRHCKLSEPAATRERQGAKVWGARRKSAPSLQALLAPPGS